MSQPGSQWLLKVIAGPHQGAEIDLSAGKTLIGSDDGCDVVLHDVLIAPQHLAIEATPKSIQVEPLGGRVYWKGKRVRDPRQKIDPFTFITVGGTHLVVGPAEGKWPLLSAADAPELEKEAPEPEDSGEAAPNSTPAASPGGPATAVAAAPAQANRRMNWKTGLLTGVVILGAWLGLMAYYGGLPNSKPGDYPENGEKETFSAEDVQKRAQKVLDDAGVADTVKLESVEGRVFANGYVKDTVKQREVEVGFRNHAPGVIPKIWSLEQITASARERLKNKDLDFDVQAKRDGVLTVIGVGTNRTLPVWEQLRKELVRDIPGVKRVEDLVKSAALIAAQPLPQPLPPPPPQPAPVVPEVTTPAAAPAPQVREEVARPLFRTVDGPEATITEISSRKGGLPFFRLSSGGAYYNGSKLPFGGVVTSITDKAVVIREDERDRTVAVGQKVRRDPVPDLPEPDAGASANTSSAKP